MENLKNLKNQENVLNDEELDHVTGGMKTFSVLTADSSKETVVTGGADDTIRYSCPICNYQAVMDHDAFFAHIKTYHPEKI